MLRHRSHFIIYDTAQCFRYLPASHSLDIMKETAFYIFTFSYRTDHDKGVVVGLSRNSVEFLSENLDNGLHELDMILRYKYS